MSSEARKLRRIGRQGYVAVRRAWRLNRALLLALLGASCLLVLLTWWFVYKQLQSQSSLPSAVRLLNDQVLFTAAAATSASLLAAAGLYALTILFQTFFELRVQEFETVKMFPFDREIRDASEVWVNVHGWDGLFCGDGGKDATTGKFKPGWSRTRRANSWRVFFGKANSHLWLILPQIPSPHVDAVLATFEGEWGEGVFTSDSAREHFRKLCNQLRVEGSSHAEEAAGTPQAVTELTGSEVPVESSLLAEEATHALAAATNAVGDELFHQGTSATPIFHVICERNAKSSEEQAKEILGTVALAAELGGDRVSVRVPPTMRWTCLIKFDDDRLLLSLYSKSGASDDIPDTLQAPAFLLDPRRYAYLPAWLDVQNIENRNGGR